MKKFSLYFIVDYCLKFALIFTLNLIWCLYFIKTTIWSFLASFSATIFEIWLIDFVSNKRKNRKIPKLKEKEHQQNVISTFVFMDKTEQINFFYKLAKTKHNAKVQNNYILVDERIVLYPFFHFSNLTYDQVIEIYNSIPKQNIKKIIILCNKCENLDECLNNFVYKTIILNGENTYYELLKKYEFYPKITVSTPQKAKTTFKKIYQTAINKKKTKSYVLCAFFMIFASIFVRYKLYYFIVASVLLVFAILSYFEFKVSPTNKEELLN